jgi:YVTN family beta-propeller protein
MKSKLILSALLAVCFSLPAYAQLNQPNGLAFDTSGNLWVANNGANQVLELNPTTGAVLNTITTGISGPTRLEFVGPNLYVTNFTSNTVTVYNKSLALTRTISGLSHPLGIAVDNYGDVYVANNMANNIVGVNPAGDNVLTLTQDESGVLFTAPGALAIFGQDIYVATIGGDIISYNVGNFLTAFPFEITKFTDSVSTGPTGIVVNGNVYVCYRFSNDVVKYSSTGKKLLTITASLSLPEGIALDKSGNIYVSNDTPPYSITVYNSAGTLVRTLDGGAITPTTINFDTTPGGSAIASGTSVVNTYSSDGVTFQFVPCTLGTLLCQGGSGVFAVAAGSGFAFSAPNVVSTIANTPLLQQQWGTVRANFSSVQTSVSIEVLQTCIGQDAGCLGGVPASEAAFLSAFNSSGTLLQTAEADPNNTATFQKLTVSDPSIAYVEFSVPYDAINTGANQLGGDFDNLTF